ncbi:MAG: hypothetical protein ACTS8R_09350 [Arsenophonus sp. NC-QC1-MAG3]
MSDQILEKFNAECVSYFLEPIIDKESIIYSDEVKWYVTFASYMKLVTIA